MTELLGAVAVVELLSDELEGVVVLLLSVPFPTGAVPFPLAVELAGAMVEFAGAVELSVGGTVVTVVELDELVLLSTTVVLASGAVLLTGRELFPDWAWTERARKAMIEAEKTDFMLCVWFECDLNI
jgi:hypothetical protein